MILTIKMMKGVGNHQNIMIRMIIMIMKMIMILISITTSLIKIWCIIAHIWDVADDNDDGGL